MMLGMGSAPIVVGRHGQNADDAPRPIVGLPVREKGAMAAVMLDQEEPDKEAGGGNGEHQAPPEAISERGPGQSPADNEWCEGDRQFERAAPSVRLTVAGHDLRPWPVA